LLGKAEVLFSQQAYPAAQALAEEGLSLAADVGRADCLFRGRLLQARLLITEGDRRAGLERLQNMLAEATDPAQRADLYYELWRLDQNREHARAALNLYQQLRERTPGGAYEKQITELKAAG